jgi:hypothetical protein
MPTAGPLEFRATGGLYVCVVQAASTFQCVDAWLYATLRDADLVGARVYPGWMPQTESVPAGDLFITYRWVRNLRPVEFPFGHGPDRPHVAYPIYEVLVWVQGKTYDPTYAPAATLVGLLDVANVASGDGTISAELYEDTRGYFEQPVTV